MSEANLCRQGETFPYNNVYQFSGKLLTNINDCLGSSYQTTEQKYTYDSLYQLIRVDGECKYSSLKDNYVERDDTYTQTFSYDNIGNLLRKTCNFSEVSGLAYTDLTNYDYTYDYDPDYAHRLKKAHRFYYQYDSNGNIRAISTNSFEPEYDIQIKYVGDEIHFNWNVLDGHPPIKKRNPGQQRNCFYDDRNQMSSTSDYGTGYINKPYNYYHYDEDGKRTSKQIYEVSEVLTFNDFFCIFLNSSNKWELGQTQKTIMLGNTRLVSKIDSGTRGSTRKWKDQHTFYYLSDHIGTANFITTYEGEIYQITEYTPYGERWIERTQNKYNDYYLPYRFAGKPLDEETGWYYFGARYYDPKYQIWTTADPALSDYFSDTQKGEGGVFNHINLNTYHYGENNPIRYVDPDGNWAESVWDVASLCMGAVSFWNNLKSGNVKGAIADGLCVLADTAAVVLPFIPGGAGAVRAARAVAGAATTADGVTNIVDGVKNNDLVQAVGGAIETVSGGMQMKNIAIPRKLKTGDTVYRVYGGDSNIDGACWTTQNPLMFKNYRKSAGLPNSNTGEYLVKGVIKDPSKISLRRFAKPLDGNFGRGATEYIISNPFNGGGIELKEIIKLNNSI